MRIICLFYFHLLWLLTLAAQNGVRVENVGIEQGLSQGFVTAILQDREGFLWAGTQSGLNRFDGYRFRVFENDPYDSLTLSGNYVYSLSEYRDFLLVGTIGQGLNIFHKKTERFFRIPFEMRKECNNSEEIHSSNRTPGNSAFEALPDADGNLWLLSGSNQEGAEFLGKLTLPEGFWDKLPDDPALISQIRVTFWCIQSGNAQVGNWPYNTTLQQLWLMPDGKRICYLSDFGIWTFNAATAEVTSFGNLPVAPQNAYHLVQNAEGTDVFLQDKDGKTWYSKDPNWAIWTEIPAFTPLILYFNHKILWTSTLNTKSAFAAPSNWGHCDFEKPQCLLNNTDDRVVFCVDRTNNFWYTNLANGLLKVKASGSIFEHHLVGNSVMSKPVAIPDGGYLYKDLQGNSYFSHPSDKAKWAEYHRFLDENKLHVPAILAQPASASYWATAKKPLTEEIFLMRIKVAGSVYPVEHWALPYLGNDFTLPQPDENGKVWLVAQKELVCFDPQTGIATGFDFGQLGLGRTAFFALQKTADGSWWLASNKGLVRAKPKQNVGAGFDFSLLKTDLRDRNSLNENNVASLLTDPRDPSVLWIGTKGGGLNRLDVRSMQFSHLSTKDGLPNNVIYGILPDSSGYLWLSSNRGLIRYLPATGEIKSYRAADGLQNDEFNTWAYSTGFRGELIFGGINGLNVFFPNQVLQRGQAVKTLITGLKVNNSPVKVSDLDGKLTEAAHFCKKIVLSASQNQLTFEFSSFDFSAQNKCQYRYYLEGAEDEWAHQGEEPFAVYTNLPPGKYTFKVLGSNANLDWNGVPAEMSVEILPPWYRTWWAYGFYTLLLSLLVWKAFDFQVKRAKMQNELAFKDKEARSLQAVDELKTRFFTNITHEFRTPLTLIIEPVRQLLQRPDLEKIRGELGIVFNNSNRLLLLVNQLLDLSKIEDGKIQVNWAKGDLLPVLREIFEHFEPLAAQKRQTLLWQCDLPELTGLTDRQILEKMTYNLLSNAHKFTPASGSITLRVEKNGADGWKMEVSDTGIGIAAEQLPHIFDRFYQSDNSLTRAGEGTGIGLALVKELCEAVGGRVAVESSPGQGSVFSLVFPLRPAAAHGLTSFEKLSNQAANTQGLPDQDLTTFGKTNLPDLPDDETRPSVLLVEDNAEMRQFLNMVLCQQGFAVREAENGQIGVEMAREWVPDLLITDLMMPQMDGYQLTETLKNDAITSHIPIVMLTAKGRLESKIEGYRRGADAYLPKPFNTEELLVRLQQLLDARRRMQEKYQTATMPAALPQKPAASPAPPIQKPLAVSDMAQAVGISDMDEVWLQSVRTAMLEKMSQENFTVDDLTAQFFMNRTQFFAKFKALTGLTPARVVRDLRLDLAHEILKTRPGIRIADVVYEIGMTDAKNFTEIFKERFGVTPQALKSIS
jgi:signal transduction histidine kinase/DNA-binding response OmpR family regulator/streptogramin lyase